MSRMYGRMGGWVCRAKSALHCKAGHCRTGFQPVHNERFFKWQRVTRQNGHCGFRHDGLDRLEAYPTRQFSVQIQFTHPRESSEVFARLAGNSWGCHPQQSLCKGQCLRFGLGSNSSTPKGLRSFFAFLALLLFTSVHAEAPAPTWPDGCRFLIPLEATEESASYDVTVPHNGLAQPDARDFQVFTATGKPVSHFISYADSTTARILFDGAAGTPSYSIYFGNLDPKLPAPPPDGLILNGRKEWKPEGGFTCTTYQALQPLSEHKYEMLSTDAVIQKFALFKKEAEAGQKDLEAKPEETGKPKPVPFIAHTIHQGAFTSLPNLTPRGKGGFYSFHIFQSVIHVEKPDTYYFNIGDGNGFYSNELQVLIPDGRTASPVIEGSFKKIYGIGIVAGMGHVRLEAGRHVLDLYTVRTNPLLKVRVGGPDAPMQELDGRFSHFDHSIRLAPGELKTQSGSLEENYLSTVDHWITGGKYSTARALCRAGKAKFSGDQISVLKFNAAEQKALDASNARFWPTEGKYPSRVGAVPDAAFGPPFHLITRQGARSFHDVAGSSSTVWTEDGQVYGIPFKVFREGWRITSGISLYDGVLYAGMKHGKMLAIDYSKNKLLWSFPGEGPCYGTPLFYQGKLYYGSLDRRLYALDTERGRMLWNFPSHGWIEGSPAAADGTIYFGDRSGRVFAVDAVLGVERWNARLKGRIIGTPSCSNGSVFIGTDSGQFAALDGKTGKTLWSYEADAAIESGSCVGHGQVSFGDKGGRLHSLNAMDGKLRWSMPCEVGGPVTAAPILVGQVLYGGTSDGKQYWGVDIEEGKLGWSEAIEQNSAVLRPPIFADGQLIFTGRTKAMKGQGWIAGYSMAALGTHVVKMATEPISVDGNLTDPAWTKSERIPVFYNSNGMKIGDDVEAKMTWNDEAVYLGIIIRDLDLVSNQSTHDGDFANEDSLSVYFDPNRNGTAATRFGLTVRGTRSDSILTKLGNPADAEKIQVEIEGMKLPATGSAWNTEWKAVTSNGGSPTSWTAEIAIPLASLPQPLFAKSPKGQTWHINIIVNDVGKASPSRPARKIRCAAPTFKPGDIGPGAKWLPIRFE